MADNTGIEWTDATWNPTTGCDKISAGCDNCYALNQAARLKAMGSPRYQTDGRPPVSGPGFGLTMHSDSASYQPLRWARPRKIFVNSMSDLFHPHVQRSFVARVYAVMMLAPQHTYQILTKRPERMRRILTDPDFVGFVEIGIADVQRQFPGKVPSSRIAAAHAHLAERDRGMMRPLSNVWLGTSVEHQKTAKRVAQLCRVPAAIRFLSCEPLIGPVDLDDYLWDHTGPPVLSPSVPDAGLSWQMESRKHNAVALTVQSRPRNLIHWVIVGGESGAHARPMHPAWALDIRDQCVAAGVPFHFKQWGEWKAYGRLTDGRPLPINDRKTLIVNTNGANVRGLAAGSLSNNLCELSDGSWDEVMHRESKHSNGRTLDGQTWDEYPEPNLS